MFVDLDIVEAFKRSLSNLDWMDQTSAEAAAEKVCFNNYH
jgi:predicted metalloendopeptidase